MPEITGRMRGPSLTMGTANGRSPWGIATTACAQDATPGAVDPD